VVKERLIELPWRMGSRKLREVGGRPADGELLRRPDRLQSEGPFFLFSFFFFFYIIYSLLRYKK